MICQPYTSFDDIIKEIDFPSLSSIPWLVFAPFVFIVLSTSHSCTVQFHSLTFHQNVHSLFHIIHNLLHKFMSNATSIDCIAKLFQLFFQKIQNLKDLALENPHRSNRQLSYELSNLTISFSNIEGKKIEKTWLDMWKRSVNGECNMAFFSIRMK